MVDFRVLVDRVGRCIPLPGMPGKVVDPHPEFDLTRSEPDYASIMERLRDYLWPELESFSTKEFIRQASELVTQVKHNKSVRDLLMGVWLPIVIPRMNMRHSYYGTVLDKFFLPALKKSYEKAYPTRKFINVYEAYSSIFTSVVGRSRHLRLIDRLASGPVVLLHFYKPLQGFSHQASFQMIELLPKGFTLSGVIDTAVSITANPQILGRDQHTPNLNCFGNYYTSPNSSLYFQSNLGGLSLVPFNYETPVIGPELSSAGLSYFNF